MPETFKKAPPKIVESIPRVENQGNNEKIENNFRAVQKIAEIGKDTRPERGFRVTAKQTATKIEGAKDVTMANTLARAEGRDSPGQPATDIENQQTKPEENQQTQIVQQQEPGKPATNVGKQETSSLQEQQQDKEAIDRNKLREQRRIEIVEELDKDFKGNRTRALTKAEISSAQGWAKLLGKEWDGKTTTASEEYNEFWFNHNNYGKYSVPARAEAILLQRYPEYAAQNTPDKPVTPTAKEPQKDKVPVTTEKQNDAPTEKVATPTNEQTSKTATKEPQKDTVPVTAETKQATQSTEQQTEQTEQTAEMPKQEFSESHLSEAESVGPGDNQERLEKVVESLKSQVKSLEDALQKGSEVRENIRKGIFGPKVLFMLRLINILANNPVITKLLSLDSKVADIKDLWSEYQDMKDKTKSRRKSSDSFQGAAAAASGEAPDRGSETKEANFENSNLNFLKEISEEFLKSVIAELNSEGGGEGLNINQIRADITDELDSLVDVGKEVDLRKLSSSNPRILENIKNSVQGFARGKGTKKSLGLNIMAGIKS